MGLILPSLFWGGAGLATIGTFIMVAFAQTTGQTPTQLQSADARQQDRTQMEQQMTVVGCVQRESDYRRARALGQRGAAGTGLGTGNEFVLTDVAMSIGSTPAAPSGTAAGTPTGTAGTSTTVAYATS